MEQTNQFTEPNNVGTWQEWGSPIYDEILGIQTYKMIIPPIPEYLH